MDVCRICTRPNEDKISILDTYRTNKNNVTYADIILFCLELKIPEDTTYKKLCNECSIVLKSFYEFKILAIKNESLLEDMTFTASNEVKIERIDIKELDCNSNNPIVNNEEDIFPDYNYIDHTNDDYQMEYLEEFEAEYLDEFEAEYLDTELIDRIQNDDEQLKNKLPKNEIIQLKNNLPKNEIIHGIHGKDGNLFVGSRERKSKIKAVATLRRNLKDEDEPLKDEDPEYLPPGLLEIQSSNNTNTLANNEEKKNSLLLETLRGNVETKKKNSLEKSLNTVTEKNSNLENSCNFNLTKPKSCQTGKDKMRENENKIITSEINGITVYNCQYCLKIFKTEVGYKRHLETHQSSEFLATCDICYGEYKNVDLHKAESHKVGEMLMECPYCPRKFTSRKKLQKHSKTKHKKRILARTLRAENPIVCQFCSKIFYVPNQFKRHEMSHTKERKCICDICSKGFLDKAALRYHMRRHYGLKPEHCKICNKAFVNKGALSNHMVSHSTEQPYSCRFCDVKFKQKYNKDAHEKRAHPLEVQENTHPTQQGTSGSSDCIESMLTDNILN